MSGGSRDTRTLLTADEVADQLRCTSWFVRRELTSGALRGSKVAGHWRVTQEAVDRYLLEHSNDTAVPVTPVRRRRRRSA
jgi:excisionase family DNA binding protein